MSALSLPVFQPEAVTQPGDRFRCEPYRCVLSAATCVLRQQQAQAQRRFSVANRPFAGVHCADCAVGRTVAARVKVAPRGGLCTNCGRPVKMPKRLGNRDPRCGPCRTVSAPAAPRRGPLT